MVSRTDISNNLATTLPYLPTKYRQPLLLLRLDAMLVEGCGLLGFHTGRSELLLPGLDPVSYNTHDVPTFVVMSLTFWD